MKKEKTSYEWDRWCDFFYWGLGPRVEINPARFVVALYLGPIGIAVIRWRLPCDA